MSITKNVYVDSLIDYILDVKPYHTKLTEVISEFRFTDQLSVKLADEFQSTSRLAADWSFDYTSDAFRTRYLTPDYNYPRYSLEGNRHYIDLSTAELTKLKTAYNLTGYQLKASRGTESVVLNQYDNSVLQSSTSLVEGIDYHVSKGIFSFLVNSTGNSRSWTITDLSEQSTQNGFSLFGSKNQPASLIREGSIVLYSNTVNLNDPNNLRVDLKHHSTDSWLIECITEHETIEIITPGLVWSVPHSLNTMNVMATFFHGEYGPSWEYPLHKDQFIEQFKILNSAEVQVTNSFPLKGLVRLAEVPDHLVFPISPINDGSWTVQHNLKTNNVIVQLYEELITGELKLIEPITLTIPDTNHATLQFTPGLTGKIFVLPGYEPLTSEQVAIPAGQLIYIDLPTAFEEFIPQIQAYDTTGSVPTYVKPYVIGYSPTQVFIIFPVEFTGKIFLTHPKSEHFYSVSSESAGLIGFASAAQRFSGGGISFLIESETSEVNDTLLIKAQPEGFTVHPNAPEEVWSLIKVNPISISNFNFTAANTLKIVAIGLEDYENFQADWTITCTATTATEVTFKVEGFFISTGVKFVEKFYTIAANTYFDTQLDGENINLSTGEKILRLVFYPRSRKVKVGDFISFNLGYEGVSYSQLPYDYNARVYPSSTVDVLKQFHFETAAVGQTYFNFAYKTVDAVTVAGIVQVEGIDYNLTTTGIVFLSPLAKHVDVLIDITDVQLLPTGTNYDFYDAINYDTEYSYYDLPPFMGELKPEKPTLKILPLSSAFTRAIPETWTLTYSLANGYFIVEGSHSGVQAPAYFGKEYDNGLIRLRVIDTTEVFDILKNTGTYRTEYEQRALINGDLADGDSISFTILKDRPNYLVHGSVTGFTEPAVVGQYYWNGLIGFNLQLPYYQISGPFIDPVIVPTVGPVHEIQFDNIGHITFSKQPRFDSGDEQFTFDLHEAAFSPKLGAARPQYLVKSSLRGDLPAAPIGQLYQDFETAWSGTERNLKTEFTIDSGNEGFVVDIVSHPYKEFHSEEVLFAPGLTTGKLVVNTYQPDDFRLSINNSHPELGGVGYNVPTYIVNAGADPTCPDRGVEHEMWLANSGHKVGTLRRLYDSTSSMLRQVIDFEADFAAAYLPLNRQFSFDSLQADIYSELVKVKFGERVSINERYSLHDNLDVDIDWHDFEVDKNKLVANEWISFYDWVSLTYTDAVYWFPYVADGYAISSTDEIGSPEYWTQTYWTEGWLSFYDWSKQYANPTWLSLLDWTLANPNPSWPSFFDWSLSYKNPTAWLSLYDWAWGEITPQPVSWQLLIDWALAYPSPTAWLSYADWQVVNPGGTQAQYETYLIPNANVEAEYTSYLLTIPAVETEYVAYLRAHDEAISEYIQLLSATSLAILSYIQYLLTTSALSLYQDYLVALEVNVPAYINRLQLNDNVYASYPTTQKLYEDYEKYLAGVFATEYEYINPLTGVTSQFRKVPRIIVNDTELVLTTLDENKFGAYDEVAYDLSPYDFYFPALSITENATPNSVGTSIADFGLSIIVQYDIVEAGYDELAYDTSGYGIYPNSVTTFFILPALATGPLRGGPYTSVEFAVPIEKVTLQAPEPNLTYQVYSMAGHGVIDSLLTAGGDYSINDVTVIDQNSQLVPTVEITMFVHQTITVIAY